MSTFWCSCGREQFLKYQVEKKFTLVAHLNKFNSWHFLILSTKTGEPKLVGLLRSITLCATSVKKPIFSLQSIEFIAVNTKLPEMIIFASERKVRFDLMITGSTPYY